MRRFRFQFAGGVALFLLICALGCQSSPEGEKTLAVPSFGGVPEQWEPEFEETVETEDEDLDLGL